MQSQLSEARKRIEELERKSNVDDAFYETHQEMIQSMGDELITLRAANAKQAEVIGVMREALKRLNGDRSLVGNQFKVFKIVVEALAAAEKLEAAMGGEKLK